VTNVGVVVGALAISMADTLSCVEATVGSFPSLVPLMMESAHQFPESHGSHSCIIIRVGPLQEFDQGQADAATGMIEGQG
jgi:hypothetical protein